MSLGLLVFSSSWAYSAPKPTPAPIPTSTPAAIPSVTPAPTPLAASAALSVPAASGDIKVNVEGQVVPVDPAPLLQGGRVFVPLRGVLENLGARVNYFPADTHIEISQQGHNYTLRPGDAVAKVDNQIVAIEAPRLVAGRAFVPLRSLAELFGYRVNWLPATRMVAISASVPVGSNARQALNAAGPYGVAIDFTQFAPDQVGALLDAAKDSGAGLIKTRFDWGTLEPTKGAPFEWGLFDTIVGEARKRGLVVVGVLGDTAPWASVSRSADPNDLRQSPPAVAEFPAWRNYVRRVVGRYKADVRAWQVWENPSAQNLRSVARSYRRLAREAVDTARDAYPPIIVQVAEPGGVNLHFVSDLNSNGLTARTDGVAVYPVASWQPNAPAAPEEFLRPYATVREQLQLADSKPRDYWVGGLSYPVATQTDVRKPLTLSATRSLQLYTERQQADYLIKAMTLGLVSGSDKVFYSQLQDDAASPTPRDGVTVEAGLLKADGTPRLAYTGFQSFIKQVGRRPFRGSFALNRDLIAVLFDDGKTGTLVAWSPNGNSRLLLDATGTAPSGNFVTVPTLPESQILDASGRVVGPANGAVQVGTSPLIVTNIGFDAVNAPIVPRNDKGLRLDEPQLYAQAQQVSASLAKDGAENGLYWRRLLDFGGAAQEFREFDGRSGLTTQPQRDIFDLKSSLPFIYFDVANDFVYGVPDKPLQVTVEVKRPPVEQASMFNETAGFNIEYDTPAGYKATLYQVVKPGQGWATYTFPLPNACFVNSGGYDLLINVGGAKRPLTFGQVTIQKVDPASSVEAPAENSPTKKAPNSDETPAPVAES